ncbi:VWA domain-containing protein [Candidatus Pelagadaptatus aseana]|uniref:VWA domain-containing protein n=1 Tax=Candidatus Pelagadaptatus aseana TaxID=3120508 RepID=UPI003C6ECEF2
MFDKLWVFLLLPLPLLVAYFGRAYKTQRDALRVPFFKRFVDLSGYQPGDGALVLRRNRLQKLAILISWLLLLVALADPHWVGKPIVKQQSARDLMMAVDLSGSMEVEDFVFAGAEPIERLAGVKQVLGEFVAAREQDRLGLIVFGSAPYLQIPFSLDHDLFLRLLSEVQVRMAGPKTMLGDAIGLAVKNFKSSRARDRILILLTDGNDSGSLVPPAEAAKVALDQGVVIHTIAIGDPAATGEQEMDLETLQQISRVTGGVFFRATDGEQLSLIYQQLNKLVGQDVEVVSYRPRQTLFHWPVALMVMLQLLTQIWLAFVSWRDSKMSLAGVAASSVPEQKS